MKPVAFEYERPRELSAALDLLSSAAGAGKVMAGAQSLGPMLNLRLAQPRLVVDVRRIAELHEVRETSEEVFLGSCVTHAAIEDGKAPDPTRGLMREVAANIAYRAVRNRGTIGGSLCHADPSADWPNVLPLLSAVAIVASPGHRREVPVERFMTGAFSTVLEENEILVGLRIPRLAEGARWGHYKFCRKPGEFAEAMGAVLIDEARGVRRAVIGAIHGPPQVIAEALFVADRFDSARAMEAVEAAEIAEDEYERQIHFVALKRAAVRALSMRERP
jgi:carbon-monoxide dehydrogenase medium subunit